MRWELFQVEGVKGYQNAGTAPQLTLQGCQQRLAVCVDSYQYRAGGIRCWNKVAAQVLRQRTDQRGHQLFAQCRHLPCELVAPQPREHIDRYVDRDAIVGGAGLEAVGQWQRDVAGLPDIRPVSVDGVPGTKQILAGERQQIRCRAALLTPPRVEVLRRNNIGGYPRVVKLIHLVVAHEQV